MGSPRKKEASGKTPKGSTRKTLGNGRLRASEPEQLDQTPVAIPAGYGRPRSIQEMLATMVRDYVQLEKEGDEFESWDEANDFEPDPDEEEALLEMSPYTLTDLNVEDEIPLDPPPEAPQETITDPANPDPAEVKAEPHGNPAGLEPQNHLPTTE